MSFTSRIAENTTSGTTAQSSGRKLCIDSNGRIWSVYRREVTYDRIFAAYSDDGGKTWTEEQVNDEPSSSVEQTLPSIAVDSSDDIHVVWRCRGFGTDTSSFNIAYKKRINSTSTWGSQELITDLPSFPNYQYDPSMAVDSNGYVHVVWGGFGWGVETGDINIQYRKRTSSWQTQEALTDISVNQWRPSIALDSSDQPHVIWSGDGYGNNTVDQNFQYRMRTGSWQTREPICDVSENQFGGSMCLDSDDVPHVVWHGKTWGSFPSATSIVYSSRTGGTWSTGFVIDDSGSNQELATIAVDNADELHVVWSIFSTGTIIRYSSFLATAWATATSIISRAGYFQSHPHIMWAKTPSTLQLSSGFTFIWRGNDADGLHIEYYRSYSLLLARSQAYFIG